MYAKSRKERNKSSMSINLMNTSKLLLGLALLGIAFSCHEQQPEPAPAEPPYRWKLKTRMFTGIQPVYADESYFIFPTDYQSGEMFLLRVDEKTGNTIYNVQLLGLDDNLSSMNAKAYPENGELHIIMDRNFYKVDMATGQIMTRYDFPNFLWRTNIQDEYIYTCSFANSLDSFYYSYFHKDIGEQHHIYGAKISDGLNRIGGRAPVTSGNRFLLPFYEGVSGSGNFDNSIIVVSSDTTEKIKIDFNSSTIGGPVFDDESNMYLYMIDRMVAYRKSDLRVLWENRSIKGGRYLQTGDKIYMVPTTNVNSGEGNLIYIIDKRTGVARTVESPACLGHLERVGDYIYYVGWGRFMKFDMINEKFIPEREGESSQPGGRYQPIYGISPNSKILFNEYGWNCFPL